MSSTGSPTSTRTAARRPRIALTPGEPAGIGPDVVVQLAQRGPPAELVCFADPRLLGERAAQLGLPLELHDLCAGEGPVPALPGHLGVWPVARAAATRAGLLDPANAGYVLATLRAAVRACCEGRCAALVTGPVHKGVINESGRPFSGHTEFIASITGGHPVMLLVAGTLRVALATTHLPLSEVPRAVTGERLRRVLRVLAHDLQARFGIRAPRIAVCGLNPHAGEGGHLGTEEQRVIEPTLAALRAEGLELYGPLPADTAFTPPQLARVDAVLAMYHDQGLPVLKHAGFGRAVNVTLGLPVVRTSVDHGTALELAGSGRAQASSLASALEMALELVRAGHADPRAAAV